MARKSTDEVQLKLRFDEALRRKIEKAATQNGRSLNSEIIHRLEESFLEDLRLDEIGERLSRIEEQMKERWSSLTDLGARYRKE